LIYRARETASDELLGTLKGEDIMVDTEIHFVVALLEDLPNEGWFEDKSALLLRPGLPAFTRLSSATTMAGRMRWLR